MKPCALSSISENQCRTHIITFPVKTTGNKQSTPSRPALCRSASPSRQLSATQAEAALPIATVAMVGLLRRTDPGGETQRSIARHTNTFPVHCFWCQLLCKCQCDTFTSVGHPKRSAAINDNTWKGVVKVSYPFFGIFLTPFGVFDSLGCLTPEWLWVSDTQRGAMLTLIRVYIKVSKPDHTTKGVIVV